MRGANEKKAEGVNQQPFNQNKYSIKQSDLP